MNNQTQKNQGRQRKGFSDSPLFNYFLKHFCKFAENWPNKKDVSRIGIRFEPSEQVPSYGYHILWELCTIATAPKSLNPHAPQPMFLTCFKNSPDFTIEMISYVRKKLARCSRESAQFFFRMRRKNFPTAKKKSAAHYAH